MICRGVAPHASLDEALLYDDYATLEEANKDRGHTPDCPLAAALREGR